MKKLLLAALLLAALPRMGAAQVEKQVEVSNYIAAWNGSTTFQIIIRNTLRFQFTGLLIESLYKNSISFVQT